MRKSEKQLGSKGTFFLSLGLSARSEGEHILGTDKLLLGEIDCLNGYFSVHYENSTPTPGPENRTIPARETRILNPISHQLIVFLVSVGN